MKKTSYYVSPKNATTRICALLLAGAAAAGYTAVTSGKTTRDWSVLLLGAPLAYLCVTA